MIRNTRVDLLGEAADGTLVHIELQSSNDSRMPLRMAEYCLGVLRQFGRFPRQILVYVGDEPLRMEAELNGPSFRYSYRVIDLRELDGERLLASARVGDNIVAVLTRLPDLRSAVRQVVERIAALGAGEREAALAQLLILAGLRKTLGPVVEEEARKMPILNDILDHEVLGREFKKGVQEGERNLLRRQIERRFGTLPAWAEERLAQLTLPEVESVGLALLDAKSLEDLLR